MTTADGPLLCKRICQVAGLGTASGQVEGIRAKLNRPAAMRVADEWSM
ncbi:hypothetical protein [Streptosporangium sp. KLBMP 9127]|nr:hypothetical protein [Streptosporangium sp. KLBMP 9127]